MKTGKFFTIAILSVLAAFAVSCEKSEKDGGNISGEQLALLDVSADGTTRALVNNVCPLFTVTDPLTADEIEFLYAMREDEKLSKDLYMLFAGMYPANQQFSKIAAAEATHIAAVEKVLDYYEIEYPPVGEPGVFGDTDRQERYNELAEQAVSPLEAFKVMAFLEEENVAVYTAVEANMENVNIKLIVSNILKGSANHLKAAVRQIAALGGSYTPSVLEQEIFDGIINSGFSGGNKYGPQSGNNGKGGNTNSEKGGNPKGNKGSVGGNGDCTGTCNGTGTGTGTGTGGGNGSTGKGYRGGR